MEREKKKVNPLYLILLVAAALLLGVLFRRMVVFVALCGVAAGMTYLNYYTQIPLDFTPIFFLSVMIAFSYGLFYSALFVLIASVPARLAAGTGFSVSSAFYILFNFLVNLALVAISPDNIILFGMLGSVAYYLLSAAASGLFSEEFEKELVFAAAGIGINVFYFLNFGGLLMRVMGL
ncbi:hypothetical protein A3K63_02670 [Candidatus Micrarchaeota archaeon RBG_16_49_10]|nr:MAG: hypothetical protein A3K63_02670 [Candidatus Micrarchaeota archaeon RBG_16_49_10]